MIFLLSNTLVTTQWDESQAEKSWNCAELCSFRTGIRHSWSELANTRTLLFSSLKAALTDYCVKPWSCIMCCGYCLVSFCLLFLDDWIEGTSQPAATAAEFSLQLSYLQHGHQNKVLINFVHLIHHLICNLLYNVTNNVVKPNHVIIWYNQM